MVVGAVAGGILGNQVGKGTGNIAATAIGAVVGGIVGSEIGRALDQQDRQLAQQAEFEALERGQSGTTRQWRNPDNGRYGEVTPSRPTSAVTSIAVTTPIRFSSTVSPRLCAAQPVATPMARGQTSADRASL